MVSLAREKDTKRMTEFRKKSLFRALKNRNYRLFFAGQSISLIGTWMQNVAMSWLVFRLTGSTVLLGLVVFLSQIPAFFLAPLAGAIADRGDRRRIMIIIQILYMLWALIVAALVLMGRITVLHIMALSLAGGFLNAFDMPTRQSFVIMMIEDRADLGNAIALNSSMFNGARLIGPAIAGILIAFLGEGMCFLINGISYCAVIAALIAMRVESPKSDAPGPSLLRGVKEGFSYAFSLPPIRAIIALLTLISLTGSSYMVLMPVFATKVLHGGPGTLGALVSSAGMGALIGALFLASRRSVLGLGWMISIASGIFGMGLILFSRSGVLWLSIPALLLCGFGMMVYLGSGNTLIQTIVEEEKRGRVMSIFTMALMGMEPVGSILAGSLAAYLGAPNTVLFVGLMTLIGSLMFMSQLPALGESLRPSYLRRAFSWIRPLRGRDHDE
jgi:MFS family permease